MPATAQELGALQELVAVEDFSYLGRMVDVVSAWISSPNLQGNVPPESSAGAAADLVDFLSKLPKAIGYELETDFVIGYQPVDFGHLPEVDRAQVVAWHQFRSKAQTHCGDTMKVDPDELRTDWVTLVDDLAAFIARRRRIARQLREVRARREGR